MSLGSLNSTTVGNFTSSSTAYYLYIFNEILLPTVSFTGFLGNILGLLLIQTNQTLKKMNSNVFLSVLAICSTVFLSTLFLMWIEPYTNTKLVNLSLIGCKIVTFCAHWSDFCCAWLIAAVALDRAVMLLRPLKRAAIYRRCSAGRITAVLVIVVGLGHTWLIPTATTITDAYGEMECMSNPKYSTVYKWFTILETAFAVCAPLLIIATSNCITAWKLRQYRRQNAIQAQTVRFSLTPIEEENIETIRLIETRQARNQRYSDSNSAPLSTRRCTVARSLPTSLPTSSRSRHRSTTGSAASNQQSPKILKARDLKLAKTLLLVTSTFLVLNVPSYLCRLFLPVVPQQPWHSYAWFFSYRIYYCHHALLFYLYIFNSTQMRKQLRPTALKLLECYCFKTVPDFGH